MSIFFRFQENHLPVYAPGSECARIPRRRIGNGAFVIRLTFISIYIPVCNAVSVYLFDVGLLWNDRRDSYYCFEHRSILKSCLKSLWVTLDSSRAQFYILWGFISGAKIVNLCPGGPLAPRKNQNRKRAQKGGPPAIGVPPF